MSDISDVMKQYSHGFISDIKRGWDKESIEGEANVNFAITSDTPTLITGEYRATGQKAWIAEYGSGSLLDKSNPMLNEYRNNSAFNAERSEDFEIRTRTGEYTDLDGKTHVGSGLGGVHGLNAEKLRGRPAIAHSPKHVMREALGADGAAEPARAKDMKQDILNAFGAVIQREVRRVL